MSDDDDTQIIPTMSPLPVGTKVNYFGSIDYAHGEYVVTRIHGETELRASGRSSSNYFIDGVGYELTPPGMTPKFGNRDSMLFYVRRGSISPIPTMIKVTAPTVSVKKGDQIRIIPERGPERVMEVAHVEHHIITLSDIEQIWEADSGV